MQTTPDFAHGKLTGDIIAGFLETYDELGSGFSEKVCCAALALVLVEKGLQVWTNVPLPVQFRGRIIGEFFADLVVNGAVIVEVKGAQGLEGFAQAQLLNYLKAAGGGVGLLLNFGRRPDYKRMVMGDPLRSLPNLRARQAYEEAPHRRDMGEHSTT